MTTEERASSQGNLKGIIEILPYIQSLGIDYLYLPPFLKSPMMDNGYDVSDYYELNPMFGRDEDFAKLLN